MPCVVVFGGGAVFFFEVALSFFFEAVLSFSFEAVLSFSFEAAMSFCFEAALSFFFEAALSFCFEAALYFLEAALQQHYFSVQQQLFVQVLQPEKSPMRLLCRGARSSKCSCCTRPSLLDTAGRNKRGLNSPSLFVRFLCRRQILRQPLIHILPGPLQVASQPPAGCPR